jgi:hypothetical protein
MSIPLPNTVGVHTYSAGALDRDATHTPVYTPALDKPGTVHKVYGWQVTDSSEPHDSLGILVRTDVQLYAPAGFPVQPEDVVDLPDGQHQVIGQPLDYGHGPFGYAPGAVVQLGKVPC